MTGVQTCALPISEHLGENEDAVAKTLAGFEVIVGMWERQRFPAGLLKRLPELKLLITTGMRNASFDIGAAAKQGVTVCGRSEEHTSELQSLMRISYAVFCLKKNKKKRQRTQAE